LEEKSTNVERGVSAPCFGPQLKPVLGNSDEESTHHNAGDKKEDIH
jgi:hypothetical protein